MKTKRIRIAVAMSRYGDRWSAQGWGGGVNRAPGENGSDSAMSNSVLDCVSIPADVHFVEVDIPIPEEHTEALVGVVISPSPSPPFVTVSDALKSLDGYTSPPAGSPLTDKG